MPIRAPDSYSTTDQQHAKCEESARAYRERADAEAVSAADSIRHGRTFFICAPVDLELGELARELDIAPAVVCMLPVMCKDDEN